MEGGEKGRDIGEECSFEMRGVGVNGTKVSGFFFFF